MVKRNAEKLAEEQIQEPAAETGSQTTQPQERQPGDEPAEPGKREFQPVRGWTGRFTGPLKYRKFTDANFKIIAFKFDLSGDEALPDEALTVMRDHKKDQDGNPTGLVFQNNRKHGKIWAIPNDAEGRALADKIDFKLSEIAQKMAETPGQGQAF
jgi:hypothetical protein